MAEPRMFTCEACGATFKSGWTEEEAREEANSLWTEEELAGGEAVICDDCFQQFMVFHTARLGSRPLSSFLEDVEGL